MWKLGLDGSDIYDSWLLIDCELIKDLRDGMWSDCRSLLLENNLKNALFIFNIFNLIIKKTDPKRGGFKDDQLYL